MGATLTTGTSTTTPRMYSGIAVTAGDLIVNTSSTKAGIAPVGATLAQLNYTSATISALKSYNSAGSTYGGVNSIQYGNAIGPSAQSMAQLGNGNFAFVSQGLGTNSATNGVSLFIMDCAFNYAVAGVSITVSTDTNVKSVRIRNLSTTQFIVSWVDGTSALKFAILNNDGTTAVSAVTVATIVATPTNNFYDN
jgi:hypothetical protein